MAPRQPLRVSDAFGLSDSEDESTIPKDAKLSNNRGSSTGVTMNVNGTVRSMKYANHSLFQGYTSVYGGFMHHEKVLEQQPQAESTEGVDEQQAGRPAAEQPPFICHLCARKFKSSAHLLKHEQLSRMHRDNLLKQKEKAEITASSA
ncbi:hypothetical protein FOZ61_007487 [Perkinsus olseni]|uniref:C2H2-type domain-containing protein n=1 Tax=Perkinsus olseni TaxID=32597 RepID=A0A7J6LIA8_PEROL|nr:hypothetical protein FOZ61_007487 [Perkinsus olseni]KAF4659012.1 hypothetical protein FOL46_006739 [Perkinsus olseni]